MCIHFCLWYSWFLTLEIKLQNWNRVGESALGEVKFVISIIVLCVQCPSYFFFYIASDICKMCSIYFYVGESKKLSVVFFPSEHKDKACWFRVIVVFWCGQIKAEGDRQTEKQWQRETEREKLMHRADCQPPPHPQAALREETSLCRGWEH